MRRKCSGPQRSSSPFDDFLNPGIIFKIASNGQAHLCSNGALGWFRAAKSEGTLSDSEYRSSSPSDSSMEEATDKSNHWLNSFSNADTSADSLTSVSTVTTASAAPSTRKKCASCSARKTPYWREGWDQGVLLCNACGIRFHKYRKYCLNCYCIAKKDESGRLHCPKCHLKL